MTSQRLFILVAATLLAGCGEREPTSGGLKPVSGAKPEPIVVYASYADEAYLPRLFASFTEQTGIRVTVRHAAAEKNIDDVIENSGSPPADLLLTPSVVGAWRAAVEGALRPLGSDVILERVPDVMRDPDGFWTAISFIPLQIIFNQQEISSPEITRYEDLANPEFKGKLCLTSATLDANRTLIAKLIRVHGNRPAEIIVRGWVSNLALPTFASDAELMHAIEAGSCAVGIVSFSAARRSAEHTDTMDVGQINLSPVHGNVEAAGINRHAREPEAARRLLEWMLSYPVQVSHSMATVAAPVASEAYGNDVALPAAWIGENVGAVAWLDEDAAKLAERAGYR